jgi:hypothetical protein
MVSLALLKSLESKVEHSSESESDSCDGESMSSSMRDFIASEDDDEGSEDGDTVTVKPLTEALQVKSGGAAEDGSDDDIAPPVSRKRRISRRAVLSDSDNDTSDTDTATHQASEQPVALKRICPTLVSPVPSKLLFEQIVSSNSFERKVICTKCTVEQLKTFYVRGDSVITFSMHSVCSVCSTICAE